MKKSKKSRDPEEIQLSASKWLSKILIERHKNKELSKTEESHIKQLCDVLLWKFSEIHGCKKSDNPFWSDSAKVLKDQSIELISDHVVPRKQLINLLFKQENPTPESIYQLLKPLCIVVVITDCENKRLNKAKLKQEMPEQWDRTDAFARYRHVNINVTKQSESEITRMPA